MKPSQRSEPTSKIPDPTALEERIRLRAYELYEARGREDGHDLDDWLQAEADFLGTKKTAIGTERKVAAA
jgi:DUF2934 family protein